MSDFIELTSSITKKKFIVNTKEIVRVLKDVERVLIYITGNNVDDSTYIEESYDQLKKLLNVRTEETLRLEETLKDLCKEISQERKDVSRGYTGSVINFVEDVEDFTSNPVSGSLNILADAAEAVGDFLDDDN